MIMRKEKKRQLTGAGGRGASLGSFFLPVTEVLAPLPLLLLELLIG